MDDLIRNIYIDILKCGDEYKTVKRVGNNVYVDYYIRNPRSSYNQRKHYELGCKHVLKPKE